MTYKYFIKHVKEFSSDDLKETHTRILDVIRESCSCPQTFKVKRVQRRAVKMADAIWKELRKRKIKEPSNR